MTSKKLKTSKQMHAAIAAIFTKRSLEAEKSQYDWKVCVKAVGAAHDIFMSIPIKGSAIEYGRSVLAKLEPFYDDYSDSDGEYTSGKSSIGDVSYDITGVVE